MCVVIVLFNLFTIRTFVERCCCEGVISDAKTPASTSSSSSSSVLSFVSTVWDNLRYSKSLTGVDLQFVRVRRQDNMTMDTLLEGLSTTRPTPAHYIYTSIYTLPILVCSLLIVRVCASARAAGFHYFTSRINRHK